MMETTPWSRKSTLSIPKDQLCLLSYFPDSGDAKFNIPPHVLKTVDDCYRKQHRKKQIPEDEEDEEDGEDGEDGEDEGDEEDEKEDERVHEQDLAPSLSTSTQIPENDAHHHPTNLGEIRFTSQPLASDQESSPEKPISWEGSPVRSRPLSPPDQVQETPTRKGRSPETSSSVSDDGEFSVEAPNGIMEASDGVNIAATKYRLVPPGISPDPMRTSSGAMSVPPCAQPPPPTLSASTPSAPVVSQFEEGLPKRRRMVLLNANSSLGDHAPMDLDMRVSQELRASSTSGLSASVGTRSGVSTPRKKKKGHKKQRDDEMLVPGTPFDDDTEPVNQKPYDQFRRCYPQYEGSVRTFVRACNNLDSLTRRMPLALHDNLFDDFVRAFSEGFSDYIEDGVNMDQGALEPAVFWYFKNVKETIYNKNFLNRSNLPVVFAEHADEYQTTILEQQRRAFEDEDGDSDGNSDVDQDADQGADHDMDHGETIEDVRTTAGRATSTVEHDERDGLSSAMPSKQHSAEAIAEVAPATHGNPAHASSSSNGSPNPAAPGTGRRGQAAVADAAVQCQIENDIRDRHFALPLSPRAPEQRSKDRSEEGSSIGKQASPPIEQACTSPRRPSIAVTSPAPAITKNHIVEALENELGSSEATRNMLPNQHIPAKRKSHPSDAEMMPKIPSSFASVPSRRPSSITMSRIYRSPIIRSQQVSKVGWTPDIKDGHQDFEGVTRTRPSIASENSGTSSPAKVAQKTHTKPISTCSDRDDRKSESVNDRPVEPLKKPTASSARSLPPTANQAPSTAKQDARPRPEGTIQRPQAHHSATPTSTAGRDRLSSVTSGRVEKPKGTKAGSSKGSKKPKKKPTREDLFFKWAKKGREGSTGGGQI